MNALKNRNLQLYFGGQIISLVGTWMQQMALSWLVFRLTGSSLMLGLLAFGSQAPSLFVTPFAGIVVDRVNRHRMILITQTLAMLQAFLLTIVVCSGRPQMWELIALSALLGIITSFDLPARQSFLVDMLDEPEQLATAIGINSSINTGTRLIGPFIAGIFVAKAGEQMCFLVNALSYIAVIAALFLVRSSQKVNDTSKKNSWTQLKEGFQYTINCIPIRNLIALVSIMGLVTMPFAVLMPPVAKTLYHGDAMTLGILTGAGGAGSMVGALMLTTRKGINKLGRWIITGCALSGIGLVALGAITLFPVAVVATFVIGLGAMVALAGSNTIVQTVVEPDKRGRVMSFVVMAFIGLSPFGAMIAGGIANVLSISATLSLLGVATLMLAVVFYRSIAFINVAPSPPMVAEALVESEAELEVLSA
jgi:MFS family permease